MQDVKDKVAFITGGASGIGLGMAQAFVAAGMKVILADVRRDHIEQALASFERAGRAAQVHAIELDVTDRAAYARAADESERVFGAVHVLCNNAGLGITGPIKSATYDDWDWLTAVMIGGVINGVQTLLPRIRAHGQGGHIVNTASMSGVFASGDAGIYITCKFAIVGMAEALRWELMEENIGVSAFLPGGVRTNIFWSHELRPAHHRTGYAEQDRRREQFGAQLRAAAPAPGGVGITMEPIEVGARVLRGILRNDLYIITHPEFREGIEARNAALIRAIPDEPLNEERLKLLRAYGTLLHNPIYAQQTTPQGPPPKLSTP
jgi:NAD(P)-dependent dehydrogenase (short-subunit alcohol dehydrogenase family)